jgi:hypothetical protein
MQDIEQRYYLVSNGDQQNWSPTWLRNKNFYLEKISVSRWCWNSEEIIEYVAATSNRMLENLKEP